MFEFSNVSELNKYAGGLLSRDERLSRFVVTGEISGLTVYRQSGHAYFTLKDEYSQVSVVMFSSYFNMVDFPVKDGIKVKIVGSADIYAANGRYQIKAFAMKQLGKGDLSEQFKLLYEKLNREGLFDSSVKKSIPVLPKRIGVVTSPSGAVIHDIIDTLTRRNPHFDLLIYPASVQGENCPKEVTEGVNYFNNEKNVDVIIVARGGGSLEDLFGFNDEKLARAIFASEIPVISAVGHEVDYTICDYVSDLRAPTPTAAAELVLGKFDDLMSTVLSHRMQLDLSIEYFLRGSRERLLRLKNHKALYSPYFYIQSQRNKLDSLKQSFIFSGNKTINEEKSKISEYKKQLEFLEETILLKKKNEIENISNSLNALGPKQILNRGYSYITSTSDDKTIKSVNDINSGDIVRINFADGNATATINGKIDKTED